MSIFGEKAQTEDWSREAQSIMIVDSGMIERELARIAPSNRAKRIALVLPDLLPLAGVERVRLLLVSELTARGYAVDLICANEPLHDTIRLPEGARLLDFAAPKLRSFLRPFAKYLRETQPDAVLASIWPLTAICCIAHRLARSSARLVVSDHNNLSVQYRPGGWRARVALRASLALTYRFADVRVAVSRGVAGDVSALSGIARDQFEVVYNPMSLPVQPSPDYAAVEAAWGGWTGRRVITVGRIKLQKNHALLIRAFQRLRRTMDARLMLIGSNGDCEGAVKQLVQTEGLGDDVILTGPVEDPTPFYERADLFVLSSDYEGFGNVIVEALAFGCPVVSTDCPYGPAEILEDGRWGRLVPTGDAEALGQAMIEALSVSHDREALKRRAADFSPGKVTERYLRLLLP